MVLFHFWNLFTFYKCIKIGLQNLQNDQKKSRFTADFLTAASFRAFYLHLCVFACCSSKNACCSKELSALLNVAARFVHYNKRYYMIIWVSLQHLVTAHVWVCFALSLQWTKFLTAVRLLLTFLLIPLLVIPLKE